MLEKAICEMRRARIQIVGLKKGHMDDVDFTSYGVRVIYSETMSTTEESRYWWKGLLQMCNINRHEDRIMVVRLKAEPELNPCIVVANDTGLAGSYGGSYNGCNIGSV